MGGTSLKAVPLATSRRKIDTLTPSPGVAAGGVFCTIDQFPS